MPTVDISEYHAPYFFRNPHTQMVFPSVFRKVQDINYVRERIITPDNDFLDLDWSRVGSRKLAIVLHGLEGDSGRSYIMGMVRTLNRRGWDALALNFRGCSGEPNKAIRMYHSGETGDIKLVIDHAMSLGLYDQLALVGFSLGGNVILKYLGESGKSVRPEIKAAVAISVPCDLKACSDRLIERSNWAYSQRFLRMLRKKIYYKATVYPHAANPEGLDSVRTLREFDDKFTAPLHGFRDAEDYYAESSSKQFLGNIATPCLLINALDDPFLGATCFPEQEARSNRHLFLERPRHGGHVGFVSFNEEKEYWSEKRAAQFISEI